MFPIRDEGIIACIMADVTYALSRGKRYPSGSRCWRRRVCKASSASVCGKTALAVNVKVIK
jgi:hypothetical protein